MLDNGWGFWYMKLQKVAKRTGIALVIATRIFGRLLRIAIPLVAGLADVGISNTDGLCLSLLHLFAHVALEPVLIASPKRKRRAETVGVPERAV